MKGRRLAIALAWIVPLVLGGVVYLFRPKFMVALVTHPLAWLVLLCLGGLLAIIPCHKRQNGSA